jgi:hypothetical protein
MLFPEEGIQILVCVRCAGSLSKYQLDYESTYWLHANQSYLIFVSLNLEP